MLSLIMKSLAWLSGDFSIRGLSEGRGLTHRYLLVVICDIRTRNCLKTANCRSKNLYTERYHCIASYPDSEVFMNPNSTSPSFGAISFFSSLTTCAWRGPLLMSLRNFCRESSVPWASPSTCMVLVWVSYLILTWKEAHKKKREKCQMLSVVEIVQTLPQCVFFTQPFTSYWVALFWVKSL